MPEFSESNQPERRGDQVEAGKGNGRKAIMSNALMLALNREVEDIVDSDGKPTRKLNQIATKLVDMAVDGDVQAIKEIFDRTDGKAAQALSISGPGGGPLDHKWTVEVVSAKAANTE